MILGSQLVTTVLDRARDPQGIATSRATALSLASTAQQVVNGIVEDVVVTQSLTLQPRTLIYQMSGYLTSCLKIQTVRDASGRDLSWLMGGADELAQIDLSWVFKTSDQPRAWATIGRDLLVIYPAPRVVTTVTVVFTQITPVLATENDSTVVANETDYAVFTLTEMLLLLKARDYAPIKPALDRFKAGLDELRAEPR